ncbi:hypothetical protein TNCV_4480851 [Trichonephila clavipes]|nr:hypothetical protein TNCV_4480851 [Trichonephila clavipes]
MGKTLYSASKRAFSSNGKGRRWWSYGGGGAWQAMVLTISECCLAIKQHDRDGPRNLEPQSSDEDDTRAIAPPLQTTISHQRGALSLDRFNMHRPPLHDGLQWHQDPNP